MADEPNAGEWVRQWEAEMAEHGYRYAQLVLRLEPPQLGGGVTYTWIWDLRQVFTPSLYNDEDHLIAYDIAHELFVKLDHLRPPEVQASRALRERLDERN